MRKTLALGAAFAFFSLSRAYAQSSFPAASAPASQNAPGHVPGAAVECWNSALSLMAACPTSEGVLEVYVVNPSSGGGGGVGGAVTAVAGAFADGAIATMGTQADAAWGGTGSGSEMALLKAIWAKLSSVGGTVSVSNLLATQPVSGTVAVSTLPSITGSVAVTSLPSITIGSGTVTLAAGANTIGALAAGSNNIGTVTLGTGSNSIGSIILGAGTNAIGSLATGSNTIGNVGLTQVYQSGTTWATTQYGFQNLGYATSSSPSYTTGNLEPFSESLKGQLYISLGAPGTANPGSFPNPSPSASAAYGPLVLCSYNSTPYDMATGDTSPTACDTASQLIVNTESEKASYTYVALITPASGPTDIETVCGSATKTVRVHGAHATTNAGTLGSAALELIKRSTADSGGTSATVTGVPLDANDAAPTATVTSYSANPSTLGTSIGIVDVAYLSFGVSSTSPPYDRQFGAGDNEQSIVLRGTASCLGIGFAGATLPGGSVIAVELKTTED